MGKKKIKEYQIFRVLLTLLVVLGHSTYYQIATNYGGIYYKDYVQRYSLIQFLCSRLTSAIYLFNMPGFFLLSGCLCYMSFRKEIPFVKFAVSKFKRLILPFLIAGLFFSFPIKYLTGYFAQSEHIWKDFLIGQLLVQGNSHLWYLETLFFVFLLFYVIEKKLHLDIRVQLILYLVMNLISGYIPIYLIQFIFQYMIWFCFGYLFERERERFNQKVSLVGTLLIVPVFAAIFLVYIRYSSRPDAFIFAVEGMQLLAGIAGCILLYAISFLLSKTPISNWRAVEILERDSLGIYLYSDPMNYVVLYLGITWFQGALFSSSVNYLLYYIIRVAVQFVVGFLVTELLRKLKVPYIV